jgi:hypothetical protein
MTRSARRSSGVPAAGDVAVEEIGGCLLLRPADERPEEQIELIGELGALAPAEGVTVVVVAVSDEHSEAMWPRLGEVLSQVGREPRSVVLAMSDAGRGRTDRDALARRIADAWGLTVVAPAGDVVLVPGGTMFAHAVEGEPEPQWWSFAPGGEPVALGLRWPAPEWRTAFTDLTPPSDGPLVTDVPAGMLVHRAGGPPPGPGGIAYAVPAAGDRPSVLVDAEVTPAELVRVLSGLVARPEWRRHPLRLVPAGAGDLLPAGQAVVRELGLDVEVLTGPPVDLTETPGEPAGRRVVLLDDAGRPAWWPFVSSVLCRPPGRDGVTPPPRPLDWRSPATGMRVADAARAVLWFGDTWRVAVTRAGLWAYPADAEAERFPDWLTAAWPAAADTVRVDVGAAGRTVDDRVWPLLDDLLAALPPRPRARLRLVVHGTVTVRGDQAVRTLATRHGAGLEPLEEPPAAEASSERDVP